MFGATPTATPAAGGAQGDLAAPTLTARANVNAVDMQWTVELQWTAAPAAVRYDLWVWWDEETGWQRLDDGNLAGVSYTHTDVVAGRTYYYTIRAVGANGETGPYSTHAPVTVPAPTPTPTSIPVGPPGPEPTATPAVTPTPTATPTATTTPTPTLTPPPIPVGPPGPKPPATPTAMETPTATTTPTATPATAPQGDLAAPALTARTTLNAVAMQWTVELQWTATPGAARYELWVWWDEETGWQRLDGGNLTGASYTHTGVVSGRTYYYAIRAVGADGEAGPYSAQAYVTVSALSAPTLRAAAGAGYVTLTWDAVPNAARYELWVWRGAETGWQRIDDGNLAGVSYTHTDVAAGLTYYYVIRAVGANGETGPWSQWVEAAVPASATRRDEAAPVAL